MTGSSGSIADILFVGERGCTRLMNVRVLWKVRGSSCGGYYISAELGAYWALKDPRVMSMSMDLV